MTGAFGSVGSTGADFLRRMHQNKSRGPGLPAEQLSARRPSVDESPEKWLITNELWSERARVQHDHNETVAWTALHLLIDALG